MRCKSRRKLCPLFQNLGDNSTAFRCDFQTELNDLAGEVVLTFIMTLYLNLCYSCNLLKPNSTLY